MTDRTIPSKYQHDWRDKFAFFECRDCEFETEDWGAMIAHDPDHDVRAYEWKYIPSWAEESDSVEMYPHYPERAIRRGTDRE